MGYPTARRLSRRWDAECPDSSTWVPGLVEKNVDHAVSSFVGRHHHHPQALADRRRGQAAAAPGTQGRRQRRARTPGRRTSNRLHCTYDQIAGLRARAKRRRRDWQHQTTTGLARSYATIVVEDLRAADMTRSARGTIDQPGRGVRAKAGLNRAILDQGWGGLVELLTYKTAECGGRLVKVPAAFTSQTCAACGHVAAGNRPSQAAFSCVACGHRANADVNAACNILRAAGLAVHGRGAA